MDPVLPVIVPRTVQASPDVAWPSDSWSRAGDAPGSLISAADAAFTREELGETNAVLVVQSGRILYERYGGSQPFFDRPAEPITESSPLLSWSMAKSLLHALVGILVDEGRLDLRAAPVLPEWSSHADSRRAITLDDLLAMRDGLDFVEDYEIGRPSDVLEMLFGAGRDDVSSYALARELAVTPGTRFNYSSGTSNIISRIVANVVGRGDDYREFITERLFDPLGMSSARATFDASGVFVASSYVHATAQDFARFGLLYLRGGEWDSRRIVPREWVETAQVPLSQDEESGNYYSRQWWVTGDPYGTYWANGYEGQMISIVPALDALVLRFGHTPSDNYPDLYRWRREVIEALADHGAS